ncbi:hypothetical protein [Haliscomenobacter sp.]|uniref:hypothetical protein n=1 Tax=Haliscomenobacter sp. TaxID=2717303 RepID=UPI0029F53510|nr:hypothetical protein [Haliscomenobacter sp.]
MDFLPKPSQRVGLYSLIKFIMIKRFFCWTFLFMSSVYLWSQGNLVLQAGEVRQINPGSYSYDQVILGPGSVVLLTGTTRLVTKKLITGDGTRIEYKKGSQRNNPQKMFEMLVTDGSQMNGILSIIGNGEDGHHGGQGGQGANGSDESWKAHVFPPRTEHRDPSPGLPGGQGGNGQDGEDAMDITVNIHDLNPNAFVAIYSNGGNGGEGGKGGRGGNGGKGKYKEKGTPGGIGGSGGNGGNGGNGGHIIARLVHIDKATKAQIAKLQEFLQKNIIALPGLRGLGGLAGDGGDGGSGGKGAVIVKSPVIRVSRGSAGGGDLGQPGNDGFPGKEGSLKKVLISASQFVRENRDLVDIFKEK